MLTKNSPRQAIKNLQERLNLFGSYGLTPDGAFGPKTRDAVKAWEVRTGVLLMHRANNDYEVSDYTLGTLGLNAQGYPLGTGGGGNGAPARDPNVVPAGTRVALSGRQYSIFYPQSFLEQVKRRMEGSGYRDVEASASGGTIYVKATLSVDKPTLEAVRDGDFYRAVTNTNYTPNGVMFDTTFSVISAAPGGAGGGGNFWNGYNPGGANPLGLSSTTLLLGGAFIIALVILRD